jgi:hypothetical protein
VKILLEVSARDYDRLLNRVAEESQAYAILKNGVVVDSSHDGARKKKIEILCEKFHAIMLLHVAEKVCPEAASQIEEGIRLSRSLQ